MRQPFLQTVAFSFTASPELSCCKSFVQKTRRTMPKSQAWWYFLLLLLCLPICVCFDRHLFIRWASSKNIGSFPTGVSVMGQMCPRCGSFNIQLTHASHYMIPKGCENIFLSLPQTSTTKNW